MKPIYTVVTNGEEIYIKKQKDILENERIFEDTKLLTEEQKKSLIETLPPLTNGKQYVLVSGIVVEKKPYPNTRKKRSTSDFQKKRARKLEMEMKEREGITTVGDKMRIIRMKKGLTLRELSELTGVHYLTIHQLENSVVLTKLENFESICLGLNLSFEKMQELYTELNLEFFNKRGCNK